MKKSIVLLSGLGIGAGVLYAIGSRGKKSKELTGTTSEDGNGNGSSDAKLSSKRKLGDDVDASQRSSLVPLDSGPATGNGGTREIDDQGTAPGEAAEILRDIRDAGFDSSDEKLALALGRPAEEIAGEIEGIRSVDGDELMKARKLAIERGIEIQQ